MSQLLMSNQRDRPHEVTFPVFMGPSHMSGATSASLAHSGMYPPPLVSTRSFSSFVSILEIFNFVLNLYCQFKELPKVGLDPSMYGGPMGSASTYSGMGMLPPPNPSAPFAPPPPPAGSFTPKV